MLTKFGVARANQKKGFRMSVVKKNFERMNERISRFDAIQHGICEQRCDQRIWYWFGTSGHFKKGEPEPNWVLTFFGDPWIVFGLDHDGTVENTRNFGKPLVMLHLLFGEIYFLDIKGTLVDFIWDYIIMNCWRLEKIITRLNTSLIVMLEKSGAVSKSRWLGGQHSSTYIEVKEDS